MKKSSICAVGANFKLDIFKNDACEWRVVGFYKGNEIDSIWCERPNGTLEELKNEVNELIDIMNSYD